MNSFPFQNNHPLKAWTSAYPRFQVKHGASLVGGDGKLPAYATKSTQIGFAVGAVILGAALLGLILYLAMRKKGRSRKVRRKQDVKAKSR
jgi:hypothetical protein